MMSNRNWCERVKIIRAINLDDDEVDDDDVDDVDDDICISY